jgi:hypothetical protein
MMLPSLVDRLVAVACGDNVIALQFDKDLQSIADVVEILNN